MSKEVAIIGCGPAGLLAAHAVALNGFTPVIYSKDPVKSPNAKATFLHRAIPDITDSRPDGEIKMSKIGTPGGYAHKAYHNPDRATSWAKFSQGSLPAWALAPAYETLWALYSGSVQTLEVRYDEAMKLALTYRIVINTAPLPSLCGGPHDFKGRDIFVIPQAPADVGENEMVYNGLYNDPWYRASNIFGVGSTEFATPISASGIPYSNGPDDPAVRVLMYPNGIKIIGNNCNCLPGVHRAGRWGTWKPGVLLHHAFERAHALFSV